jgi:phenylalanyl-tRNA synthetase alpha chain
MQKEIVEYLKEVEIFESIDLSKLELFRVRFLGKKGVLKDLSELLKILPADEKRAFGQQLNFLREKVEKKLELFKSQLSNSHETLVKKFDYSSPAKLDFIGSRHPISVVKNQIIDIFSHIGFIISEGPEIEDDWHNFSALNFPSEHPARDMQDTFFVEKNPDFSLRTHTSSVQVRVMENSRPPIRTISPGRVFRNEAVSARAHCIFHQIEGLYIDKNVSFADLKQTLLFFAKEFFGEETKIRLRPSYFPFTEPSFEMDVYWGLKSDVDYRITKGTGWLEILGCGMVDPEVLKNCKIDSRIYSGFAFGMGIERITMLKYQIGDLRMFFENDTRFLSQFSSAK